MRSITAKEIKLMWDGNAICALLGDDLVVGCGVFGESVPTALRDVANNIDADDLVLLQIGLTGSRVGDTSQNTTRQRRRCCG
jgi:hypothetical protein